jgi:hypothetical protein
MTKRTPRPLILLLLYVSSFTVGEPLPINDVIGAHREQKAR